MQHDLDTYLVALAAAATTLLATAYGLLPDRIDLFTVFAAYGAGRLLGELLATRPGRPDKDELSRRWGSWLAGLTLLLLISGLIANALDG